MEDVNQYYNNIIFWGFIFPCHMSHILPLMLWDKYAAEGDAGYYGISALQYNDWDLYSCGGWEVSGGNWEVWKGYGGCWIGKNGQFWDVADASVKCIY